MPPTVYLETTIPSYLTAWKSKDIIIAGKQEVTRIWWNERRDDFLLYVSPYVLDEVSHGDPEAAQKRMEIIQNIPVLAVDEEVARLAEIIIKDTIIPEKASTDALHIAVATRHGIDFLLTWNCTHIANAEIMRKVDKTMENHGFEIPVICTPDELMGGVENDK
ncbi:MAG: type II toxin-antitoxin system VapC family toxin [Desulfosarcina sp.]|nr:type II toxin-antitoxin system VapC family toxin [Desulfobacterales bacterium]